MEQLRGTTFAAFLGVELSPFSFPHSFLSSPSSPRVHTNEVSRFVGRQSSSRKPFAGGGGGGAYSGYQPAAGRTGSVSTFAPSISEKVRALLFTLEEWAV